MRFRIIFLCLCLLLLFSLSACGNTEKKEAATQPEALRIAYFPNLTHAQALYGKHTGAFQEALGEDIQVEWVEFNAGPSEIEAMFAGAVDIGYIGPIPAINGNLKSGGDVVTIAGATDGGAILVTRPDLVLTRPVELSGLKVAIPQLGNTQHISLLHILQENGLETTDRGGTVEVVAAANADIKTLLDQGKVDAALVPEPWGARMVQEIGANIFLDEKQVWMDGNYPVAVVIVNKDFLEKHPDTVEAFLQAHVGITSTITANPAAAKTVLNDELLVLTQSSLNPAVLDEAFGRITVTTDIQPEMMEAFYTLLVEQGFSESAAKTPEFLDTTLLAEIQGGK